MTYRSARWGTVLLLLLDLSLSGSAAWGKPKPLNRDCYRMSVYYAGSETREPRVCRKKHPEGKWYAQERQTLATRTSTTMAANGIWAGCKVPKDAQINCECHGGRNMEGRLITEDDDNTRSCKCVYVGPTCGVSMMCNTLACQAAKRFEVKP